MNRFCFLLLTTFAPGIFAAELSVGDLMSHDDFGSVLLSPDGKLLAATVAKPDRTALAVVDVATSKVVSGFEGGKNFHIMDVHWSGPDRLVYAIGEKVGLLKAPQSYGELFSVDALGGKPRMMIGQRAPEPTIGSGVRTLSVKPENVFAEVIDPMIRDPGKLLISVSPIGDAPYSKADLMDAVSGRRRTLARAPVRSASFTLDNQKGVRFARGEDLERFSQLYYRQDKDSDWVLINDERKSQRIMVPIGFSADDAMAYLSVQEPDGPDAIYTFDPKTLDRKQLLRNPNTDVYMPLYSPFDDALFAVIYMDGLPKVSYFDPENRASKLHQALQRSFPDHLVLFGSVTADRTQAVVHVQSDRNSGDVYLLNLKENRSSFLLSLNRRHDPDLMSKVQPIQLVARDGLNLHGYLSKPRTSVDGQKHPLILMPHGGPFGVRDIWAFDPAVQLLTAHGYAVLQVNYRGSDGYGRKFALAGYRQWGKAMQNDLTDATRWAIDQGLADADNIGIYGASYGAYAALMGAATQPDLYQCAAGEFGVYELPLMYKTGDISDRRTGLTYLEDTLGKDDLLNLSPTRLAQHIKIPVLLTAGKSDDRAPDRHTELMDKALRKQGAKVEAKYYEGEGHGLFDPANRVDAAERLLAFFGRHLKPSKAPVASRSE